MLWDLQVLLDMLESKSTKDVRYLLAVSIDNLDRCPHRQIVKVLEAVHLLLERNGVRRYYSSHNMHIYRLYLSIEVSIVLFVSNDSIFPIIFLWLSSESRVGKNNKMSI